jgi:hypothetical protein
MSKASYETVKERLDAIKNEDNPHYNTDRKIRAKRLKVAFQVQVTHKGSPIHGWAEATNISFSGMLLLTNFPMDILDEFSVEFTLPGHDIPVQAKARVVRMTQGRSHDEPTVLAVAFIEIEQNVSKIISGFVLENLSSY